MAQLGGVADVAMWPELVITPILHLRARVVKAHKPKSVQELGPELAIDGEDGPAPTGWSYDDTPTQTGVVDMIANTIGLDLAKHNFHIHVVDADGSVIKTTALRRSEMINFFQRASPCLVGMEACASAHYWARELMKLGHDEVDSAFVCEAVCTARRKE